jgi:HPt (histidine-containing phosphotransfer) domain-containing protein
MVTLDPDIVDLFPLFIAARARDLEAIERLLLVGNFRAIGRIGHTIRGSGGSFGFPSVSDVGSRLEDAAGRQDGIAVGQCLDALRASIATAEQAIARISADTTTAGRT